MDTLLKSNKYLINNVPMYPNGAVTITRIKDNIVSDMYLGQEAHELVTKLEALQENDFNQLCASEFLMQHIF